MCFEYVFPEDVNSRFGCKSSCYMFVLIFFRYRNSDTGNPPVCFGVIAVCFDSLISVSALFLSFVKYFSLFCLFFVLNFYLCVVVVNRNG